MRRSGLRRYGDWHKAIASVGSGAARRVNGALGGAPVLWPASLLAAGVLFIGCGILLDRYVAQGAALAAALLLGAGVVCALLAVGGLFSALVVHIVSRRDR